MKLRVWILMAALALAAASTASAQTSEPSAALMRTICEAWSTMDISKVEPYYDTESKDAFYDVAPLKYTGWKQYTDGVRQAWADMSSMKLTLAGDAQTHRLGNVAWGTATFGIDIVYKDGKKETNQARWTMLWEKRGDKWLVVHEHVSVPMPPK